MEQTIGTLRAMENDRALEKISLSCKQVYRIQNRGKAVQIQGVRGMVYVTLPGDPGDYLLRAGEKMVVRSRGLVLVQGLPEGVFRYALE